AAYHVLHRLLAPRHPPYTLTSSALHSSCARQAGRIGSISLFPFDGFDCSIHRSFRCHHSSVVKVLTAAPASATPDKQKRPGSCQTARLIDDRSLVRDR